MKRLVLSSSHPLSNFLFLPSLNSLEEDEGLIDMEEIYCVGPTTLLGLLLCLKKPEEIYILFRRLKNVSSSQLFNSLIYFIFKKNFENLNLLKHWENIFIYFLKEIFEDIQITFSALKKRTGKRFLVQTVDQSNNLFCFSPENTPNDSILNACLASFSMPFIDDPRKKFGRSLFNSVSKSSLPEKPEKDSFYLFSYPCPKNVGTGLLSLYFYFLQTSANLFSLEKKNFSSGIIFFEISDSKIIEYLFKDFDDFFKDFLPLSQQEFVNFLRNAKQQDVFVS